INVGSAGGTAIVGSGKVALIFPEDSVEKDASLRVKKGNHKHANEGYYLVVPDLVYEFYPTDFRFTKPVQIIMSYAGMQIPEKPGIAGAQLFRVIGNGHDGVLDFKLDPANKTVSGVIRNLGLYALEVENPEPPPANGMDREIFSGFGVEACDLSDNTFTIEN
ncbi:MAG: hypothetical protein IID32_11300, partial [Planctomycetes bacterium]|nr:hypothetical protein [Planctomycetota bacterium]